jgi:hypothetical protein
MGMRVIFLEVDGVLHPASASIRFSLAGSVKTNAQALWLFRWAWILDDLLAPYPDVGLIVHSSWRVFLSENELQGLLGPVARRFLGTTPRGARWESIASVLASSDIEDYLILDTCPHEFPATIDNLVACDPVAGLRDLRVQTKLRDWLAARAPEMPFRRRDDQGRPQGWVLK